MGKNYKGPAQDTSVTEKTGEPLDEPEIWLPDYNNHVANIVIRHSGAIMPIVRQVRGGF